MRKALFFLFILSTHLLFAQEIHSRNGWQLSPHGKICILIVFAEVVYDKGEEKYPPQGTAGWQAGKLPTWNEEIVDPQINSANSKGILTQYFKEMSFGDYQVIGDYLLNPANPTAPFQIKVSKGDQPRQLLEIINALDTFQTAHGLARNDFDRWTMSAAGKPKITPSQDSPLKYDHVMFIFRNSRLGDYSGYSSPGTMGKLLGYDADTYSHFNASNNIPFRIMLHEYSHQLYGGNNFHVGGGQHGAGGANYFIPFQGGWSNMGSANSSLMTCNAWDRDRMDWKGPEKQMNISAIDPESGREINADINATEPADAGTYLLRDFLRTGDALRIKLPFIDSAEYPQWIWVENHQPQVNGSRFDQFQYQQVACVDSAPAGLYMYLQVDKHQKSGQQIFAGFGDYLRPLPADGFYDYVFDTLNSKSQCVNWGDHKAYERPPENQNPFTGYHDQETPQYDLNKNGKIEKNEKHENYIERVNGELEYKLSFLGRARHAFTMEGNRKLSIGGNPSSANMLTLVSNQPQKNMRMGAPNNRKIHLNGLSIEMLEQKENGDVLVRVRFDDVEINRSLRWCADSIFLHPLETPSGQSLILKEGATIRLDRGETPTRITQPDTVNEKILFTSSTNFICLSGSSLLVEDGGELIIDHESVLTLQKGAKLDIRRGGSLIIKSGGRLVLEEGALLSKQGRRAVQKKKGGELVDEN